MAPRFATISFLTDYGTDDEFVGVVKRYGPSVEVKRLVDAANAGPELRLGNIAHACGTCLKAAA